MKFLLPNEISRISISKLFDELYLEIQFIFNFFEINAMMRALKSTLLTLLNAIFVNAKCEIEILSFSIHNSCNNTIFAFLTAYFDIVCITFVDRLQLFCKIRNFAVSQFFCISKFNEFNVLNIQFIDISCVRLYCEIYFA